MKRRQLGPPSWEPCPRSDSGAFLTFSLLCCAIPSKVTYLGLELIIKARRSNISSEVSTREPGSLAASRWSFAGCSCPALRPQESDTGERSLGWPRGGTRPHQHPPSHCCDASGEREQLHRVGSFIVLYRRQSHLHPI